jgi:MerR family Zn(II)-responsive transcriptional regulator of zntA
MPRAHRGDTTVLTIGRLAKRARVSTDSIRFYEREGLIGPTAKTSSGYRLYSDAAVDRLGFIKHAQRCGFSLAEIRSLLPGSGDGTRGEDFYRLATAKQAQIEETMIALRAMSEALASALRTRSEAKEAAPGSVEASPLMVALNTRRVELEAMPG